MAPSTPGRPPLALPTSLRLLPHLLLCRKPWAHHPPAPQLQPIYLCPCPSRGSPCRCWGSGPSWGAGERPPAGVPPHGSSGRGPGGGQGRQPGCLTAVTAHVIWGGCPSWGMLGPEAGSVRPRVVAFAGDQVSCPRRCHVSPCTQGSLGVAARDVGSGSSYTGGGVSGAGGRNMHLEETAQVVLMSRIRRTSRGLCSR